MKTAIYPGTFDPITFGHLDVIRRASELFDRVIVTLAANSAKTTFFTLEERRKQVEEAVREIPNTEVAVCRGLIVNFAVEHGAVAIIRGVRAVSDFDYEFQMALTNRKLAEKVATVFLLPHERYSYLNSSIVREVARHGGKVDCFVPAPIAKALAEKFRMEGA
ncbi:pantetheine-phosphate adenylyltransferase [candidate division KSB1 bacterium]|nr:MAG: pantetheine-phosphate adenylyltransferase [candidate division KSB1 bacterium]